MVAIYDWIPNTKNRLKLMGTVWTFGDSLTDGFRSNDTWAKTYVKWKGYIPLTYGEIISKELKYDLKNFGKGGSDNYTILESFLKNIKNIKNNDIVILGWSDICRFRMSTDLETWASFIPNFINDDIHIRDISPTTISEILVNRSSKIYIDEINTWTNFFEYIIKDFKIINWSTFNEGKINGLFVKNIEQISNETNGQIQDAHFSEAGQKQLSDILLKEINGNRKKLI